ncbi:sn-1-specific diacylglycerol lipase ABHD11-like [Parasteatoda tepidariorum]|uniref:sn-1-specific diacylglycerol lipase ABHD11-like n=1 Tax=Parasteatoda tepidariorum TaxID=114398 RepID=UPI0039BD5FEC
MDNYVPINLSYDLYESTEGSDPNLTPVVLVHGLASERKTWKLTAPIIAEKSRRKVYAYDARNYGDSEYTDEFSFSLNVDDLFHFMNVVNLPKAVLFGHSMGAFTAANAAIQKPTRVSMVITEDTYLNPTNRKHSAFICREYLRELSKAISEIPSYMNEAEARRKIVDDMFEELSEANKKFLPKEISYKILFPIKRDADGRYRAKYNEQSLDRNFSDPSFLHPEPVGLYEGPAVFLWGTKSNIDLMSHKPEIKKYFPNAEFIEFENGYHNLHAQFEEKSADIAVQVLEKYNIS